jgi:NADH:ubiquinone oxidoreductase subunit 2 (subunit N)
MGLLWIALESAGLCAAPLIYFLRTHLALEATWKYLVLSAVGVAFGLLGTFFTALASVHRPGIVPTLSGLTSCGPGAPCRAPGSRRASP